MVSVKRIIVAASLLLSGAVAAPFPSDALSAATVGVGTANLILHESRDLYEASAVEIKAKKDKKVKPTPTKGKPAKATPSKPKTTPNKDPKKDPKACPIKPGKGKPKDSVQRRSGRMTSTKKLDKILENQFVLAMNLNGATSVTVDDLSGCTALFFWDKVFRPSAYHIFCGDEKMNARKAAETIGELNLGANGVVVVTGKDENRVNAMAGIEAYNAGVEDEFKFKNIKTVGYNYENTVQKKPSDPLWRYSVTAHVGDKTMTLKPVLVPGVSRQCQ
ncbi:hypothetical protein C7974DRAFT_413546 [Boeremia exigua]|uniref:uncharacterized protein n=1 Tax=Boeremia exigua TaxID=749465 RepID=UPI001E8CE1D7|nr:uncharacterized protein C7974DRAFT_413546 [Boeremia exigua]KAH6629786.1 hypothetical protein C7974DRAFT_413546 [Boeremia exigua]